MFTMIGYMIYLIGMIFAFILGYLLLKYEEINPLKTYEDNEELQVVVLAPITLFSWLSVVTFLVFRYDELRWMWEYLKLKK